MLYLRKQGWNVLLAVLIFLEIAFMLFFRTREYPRIVNELAFFLLSLSVGIVILLRYTGQQVVCTAEQQRSNVWLRALNYGLLLAGMIVCVFVTKKAFVETPVDPAISDIIPMIQVAVKRLLAGEEVYKNVTLWGSLPVTYLPMHWLPYTLAELGRFDYRWVSVGILFIAACSALYRSNKISAGCATIVCSMLLFIGWMMLQHEQGIFTTTVEPMVAGYYMLLIISLNQRNPWLTGIAIAACLLSRYSLILWLPLWTLVGITHHAKAFIRSATIIALMVAGLYLIPFLWRDPGAFIRGYHYYSSAAAGEWNRLNPNGHPVHLYMGIGFARWFYEYLPGYSIPERIHILQRVHVALSLGSVAVMGIFYWRKRARLHPRIFLMASFKIYLAFFLGFIQVPYIYLMITAGFVSVAIFSELSRFTVSGAGRDMETKPV